MFKIVNFKQLTATSILAVLMTGTIQIAPSISSNSDRDNNVNATGSLSPTSYEDDIIITQTVSLDRTVTVNVDDVISTTTAVVPQKLDILFLADNTGSMGSAISNVQQNAQSLMQTLSNNYNDIQFGVARYYGDPQETRCVKYKRKGWWYFCTKEKEVGATGAYELQEAVNGGTISDAVAAINDWSASGGGDWPEANFFALHQAATSGAATDENYRTNYNTNWRSDAKKIIVWFGDAKSHTNTVSKEEAINALKDNDISVVAIHSTSTSYSLTNGLDADSQASSITEATDGAFASVYSSEVASTMTSLIDTVAVETTTTVPGTVDLNFASEGDTEGLTITYTCTDVLGCTDVLNGESRTFRMDITGNNTGTYNFNTIVTDVSGAIASNNIIVTGYAD